MSLKYSLLSKFYDLIDIFYFYNGERSPRKCILEFIPDEKLKILEVCVGTGANSIIIAENRKKSEITGIDLSEEMLKIGNKKIEKKGIENIKTVKMDATKLTFEKNSFDIVLISLVLHEVDENIKNKIMSEIARVLKSKGKLIIVEWEQPEKLIQKVMFLIIKLLEPKGFREFLNSDICKYIGSFYLKILSEKKCSYTRIIEAVKGED